MRLLAPFAARGLAAAAAAHQQIVRIVLGELHVVGCGGLVDKRSCNAVAAGCCLKTRLLLLSAIPKKFFVVLAAIVVEYYPIALATVLVVLVFYFYFYSYLVLAFLFLFVPLLGRLLLLWLLLLHLVFVLTPLVASDAVAAAGLCRCWRRVW